MRIPSCEADKPLGSDEKILRAHTRTHTHTHTHTHNHTQILIQTHVKHAHLGMVNCISDDRLCKDVQICRKIERKLEPVCLSHKH